MAVVAILFVIFWSVVMPYLLPQPPSAPWPATTTFPINEPYSMTPILKIAGGKPPPSMTNFVPRDFPGIVGSNSTGLFVMLPHTKAVPCIDDPSVVCYLINETRTFIPNNSNSALPPSH